MNNDQIDRLVEAASAVRDRAYAPYSGYRVGAAVLTADGRVFTGCNVENASYGLGVCAERHAVAAAVAGGGRNLVAVAVVTTSSPPASPCGACRQVLAEFGNLEVVMANIGGERRRTTVAELLPDAFDPATLAAAGDDVDDADP
jgi:cytidine deaminase